MLEPLDRRPPPWAVACLGALLAVFLWSVGGLAASKWRLYVSSWDLAIYDQAVWLLARGEETFLTTRGLYLWEHHWQPLLYPVAWLYRLAPGPLTLVWTQAVAVALGAIPVYILSRELTRRELPGLLWAAIYLFNPSLQANVLHDFHPPTLAVPLLLTALLYVHRAAWRPAAVWLALALLSQENAGLAVVGLGLGLLAARQTRPGLALLLAGGAMTLLATRVFLPAAARTIDSAFYVQNHFGAFGGSILEVLLAPLRQPAIWWEMLTQPGNGRYLLHLLLPLAGLCLLKPTWLAGALPTLYLNLLCDFWPARTIGYHYTAYLNPFLILGAVAGGAWLSERLIRDGGRPAVAWLLPPALACCATFVLPVILPGPAPQPPTSPLQTPAIRAAWEARRTWAAECDRLVALIPPGDSVATNMLLLDHVSARREAWLFPNPFVRLTSEVGRAEDVTAAALAAGLTREPVDWLLLQPRPQHATPLPDEAYPAAFAVVERSPAYELVEDIGAVRLYRRVTGRTPGPGTP